MSEVKVAISAQDNFSATLGKASSQFRSMEGSVNSLSSRVTALAGALGGLYISNKLWEGFTSGLKAVDDFQMSVVQMAATITSLQGGDNIAENYKTAKEYAEGLQVTLMKVDANTSLNLSNLQQITFEMTKQGVLLDTNNQQQVEAFTRIANAVAVYSNNGRNEMQVRQEISALLRGEVDQNSQLASMIQRTVDGPLKQQIDKWKQSGTLLEELSKRLGGFGEASQDIGNMWSSIKSSFETAVNVILKAGFTDIVKDLVGWGEKLNTYLKDHRDMIAGEIKQGWETLKVYLSTAADIAKLLYNNFEPFAVFFIGGALVKGITSAVGMMRELLAVATAARAVMITTGVLSGGATVAGAASTAVAGGAAATGGGVMAAIGGGLLGTLGAGVAGIGLGYALQPVVRWADKKMYQGFGINLTGEAMYNEARGREAESEARWNDLMAKRGSSAPGVALPKISIQDTEEQNKRKIEIRGKELSVFKESSDRMIEIAKRVSEITLADLKQRYAAGTISTREYYEQEKNIALATAETKLQYAADYLKKEQEMLTFIRDKRKGTDNPEYQSELAKNIQADKAVSDAALDLKKIQITEESKYFEALRKRDDEYTKLISKSQEDAGEFVKATETKIAAERRSVEFLRLEKDALDGVQSAVVALAGKELEFSTQKAQAQIKENEERRKYEADTQRLADELAVLNGANKDQIQLESDLRAGKATLLELQDKLNLAIATGNQVAINGTTQQILLEKQLQQIKDERRAQEQMVGVSNGTIVGFNGDTPIYAADWKKGQYEYKSPYAAASQTPASPSGFINSNAFPATINSPFLGGFAGGTNYVPADGYAYLHKGEAVIPKAYNQNVASGGAINLSGGINITVQGGDTSTQTVNEIARKLFPILQTFQRRQLRAA